MLLSLVFIAGMTLGGLVVWAWERSRRPVDAPTTAPVRIASSALGAATALQAPPPFPVEIHLVLNVLNRLVMVVSRDEHAQEGIAALADYLSALSRLRANSKPGDPETGAAPVEAYLRLAEWQHGGKPVALTWSVTGVVKSPAGLWYLIDAVQQTLRGIEGLRVSAIDVDVQLDDDAASGSAQSAAIRIRADEIPAEEATVATAPARALQRGWERPGPHVLSVNREISL